MRRLIFTLAAVAVTLASAGPAKAGLIGIDSFGTSQLYNVSTTTGAATPLVTVTGGSASFSGLAYLNGTLYATDIFANGFRFGSIDMTTGAFTVINNQGGSFNWHGLAANQAGNVLYSIDQDNGNRLVSVTPAGVITTIGSGTGIEGRGMAYDNGNGILYATGPGSGVQSLYAVNTTTGTATLIGSTGINSYMIGLAFDDATGTLYMTASPGGQGPSNLYTLNTTTGLATLIGATGVSDLDGLEFIPTQAVPAPPAAVLAVLGLASVGGFRRLRAARG